jgi:hypothetical protein
MTLSNVPSAVNPGILGQEFAGVLGCDYFSAYRLYLKECASRCNFVWHI